MTNCGDKWACMQNALEGFVLGFSRDFEDEDDDENEEEGSVWVIQTGYKSPHSTA